jgi:hypothetical protein
MKKPFVEPDIQVIDLEAEDIICASGCSTDCPEFGTGSILES